MLGCSICYIPVLGFQPGIRRERVYDRKQFPSAVSRYLVSNAVTALGFCSLAVGGFHPLYRGTWYLTKTKLGEMLSEEEFPSAISRYLVSDASFENAKGQIAYQFPSAISRYLVSDYPPVHPLSFKEAVVSIRYIAVLGI